MKNLYRPLAIGSLSLDGNLFLAPVAGYTDRAFRAICAEQGANFSFTELVSAESVIRSDAKPGDGSVVDRLLRKAEGERHYAIQLFGSDPERMGMAAALLGPWGPSAIDINAGCPVPKINKLGAGAALMKDPERLRQIVEAVVKAAGAYLGKIPVSVKLRLGWDSHSINYMECARAAMTAGAVMVSLHGRTRAQLYGGRADWDAIGELASQIPVPVTGSGDLYTPRDAENMLSSTGCAAVMFARGLMGNPFIFKTSKSYLTTGSFTPPSMEERIRTGLRQLELLAGDTGEKHACLEMRKHFCAYTKGFPRGAALRDRLVHGDSVARYREIFKEAGLAV
ncbi:MAG: tRNA dihydrouridine synthase DusB [Treponema sp.]|nr:tRNA dihydrouridine synthase DusB [Treponema sp.]